MDKKTFIKEKIKNFSIFIADKIGEDNQIYRDFKKYQDDLDSFLHEIIKISKVEISDEIILEYLKVKGVTAKLDEADFTRVKRYFKMFVQIVTAE